MTVGVDDDLMQKSNMLLIMVLAATIFLVSVAYLYPVSRQVGGVTELTFVRTGGFIGLDEKLNIKSDGTANYISNRFGDADLVLNSTDVTNLFSETNFFTEDKIYTARQGPADYYFYTLDVQDGFNVKSIGWVDGWASEEALPSGLSEIQLHLESIIQIARTKVVVPTDPQENAVKIAKDFIVQAPTFKFDGIVETLSVVDAVTLESFPVHYIVTITFDSRQAGYGNREGQILAQVITSHTAKVTVVSDKVVSATLDNTWDELKQVQIQQDGQQGSISGKVSIGPLCPVEPCPDTTPLPYASRQIMLTAASGIIFLVKLNSDGTFQSEIAAGTYTVDLSDCTFLGCKTALPKKVTIEPNKDTYLNIDIDTGIR